MTQRYDASSMQNDLVKLVKLVEAKTYNSVAEMIMDEMQTLVDRMRECSAESSTAYRSLEAKFKFGETLVRNIMTRIEDLKDGIQD